MGKYEYDYNFSKELPLGKIASNIAKNSVVLEFGCYTGGLAKYLKEEKNCQMYAIELDEEAFKVAREYLVDGMAGDIEEYLWLSYFSDIKFDVLVFADVLEHLRNPGEVLKRASSLLKEDGKILFSIPNIAHNDVIIKLIENRFDYTETGLLDTTHVHFWGGENLRSFFDEQGMFLAELDGHMVATEETEQSRKQESKLDKNFNVFLKNRCYGEVYQFVGVVYKKTYAEKEGMEFCNIIEPLVDKQGVLCKVYYNTGNGFNEEECLSFYREAEDEIVDMTVYIPKGTKEIRFDPVEGLECVLYDVAFRCEYTMLEYKVENGRQEGNGIVFFTTDPNISVDLKGLEINKVCIFARIMYLDNCMSKYLREMFNNLEQRESKVQLIYEEKCAELREENQILGKKIEGQKMETIVALQEKFLNEQTALIKENAQLEKNNSLLEFENKRIVDELLLEKQKKEEAEKKYEESQKALTTLEKKYKETHNTLEEVSVQVRTLTEKIDSVINEREQLAATNTNLQFQVDFAEEMNKMTQQSMAVVEREKQQLVDSYRSLEGAYFAVANEKEHLVNSKSWRYTKGFRVIVSKILNNRVFSLVWKFFSAIKAGGFKYAFNRAKEYRNQKKRVKNVQLLENFDCGEICFDTLVKELTHLSATHPIAIYNIEKLAGYNSEFVDNNVLLVSHTLDLTGGPVAVRYFAKKLLEDGYSPVVFSPNGGGLVDTLVKDGIPVVVFEQFTNSDFILKYVQLFAFGVLNTIVCAPLISKMSGLKFPVIWWIHEAKVSYHPGQLQMMPQSLGDNIKIYCGGEYAKKVLLSYFPNYQADTLLYYVPDYIDELDSLSDYSIGNTAGKKVFACIGMQEERKGQDILVSAIIALPKESVEKCYFLFVGKNHYEPIGSRIRYLREKYPNNVKHIPEVTPDELRSVYKQIDCLVCTSKDDPMPIVVTEAFLMKKIVICSENAGSAQFIRDGVNGYVYRNNDYMELKNKIQKVLDSSVDSQCMSERARKIYELNFGKEAFNQAIDTVVGTLEMNSQSLYDVSVVIPTYNGGAQFKEMLKVLKNQKNCGSVEIVVVDSGSKDGTVEACKEHNVNLVEIPNEQFSHSYARNLGAEAANGKIIAFMTQDAMPSSDKWLFQMTEPIASGEVSAVSCGEQCPEGTDLYYRVASYGHANYVGFFNKDLVGSIENCTDDDTLRRNASLNDVACVVERKVFMRFKHRFNYAEDLDLGIRLLKKGYKIKLLSGVKVIHAHNRAADYYMKRAIVENAAFYRIFPDKMPVREDENLVVSRIVRSACMMSEILVQIDGLKKNHYENFHSFLKDAMGIFDSVMSDSNTYTDVKKSKHFLCPELEKLLEFCTQNYSIYNHESNINPVLGVKHYLENPLRSYIDYYFVPYSEQLNADICGCLMKQFAFSIGTELSNLDKTEKLELKVKELTKGV